MDKDEFDSILIKWTNGQKDKDLAHDTILKVLGKTFQDENHLLKTLTLARKQTAIELYRKETDLELPIETEVVDDEGKSNRFDDIGKTEKAFVLTEIENRLNEKEKILFRLYHIIGKTYDEVGIENGISKVAIKKQIDRLYNKIASMPIQDLYDLHFIIGFGDKGVSVEQVYPSTVLNPSEVKTLPIEGYQPQQSTDCNRNQLKSLLRSTSGYCSFAAGGFNVKDIGNGFKQPVQVNSMVTRSFNITQPMQDQKVDTLTVEIPIEKQITINRASYGQVETLNHYQGNQKIIDRATGCMETGNHTAKRAWFIKGNSLLAN